MLLQKLAKQGLHECAAAQQRLQMYECPQVFAETSLRYTDRDSADSYELQFKLLKGGLYRELYRGLL